MCGGQCMCALVYVCSVLVHVCGGDAQFQELEEDVRCPSLSLSDLTPWIPGLPLFLSSAVCSAGSSHSLVSSSPQHSARVTGNSEFSVWVLGIQTQVFISAQ